MSQLVEDTTVNRTWYFSRTRDEAEVSRVASWYRMCYRRLGLFFSRLCGLPFTVSISSEFYREHTLRREKYAERIKRQTEACRARQTITTEVCRSKCRGYRRETYQHSISYPKLAGPLSRSGPSLCRQFTCRPPSISKNDERAQYLSDTHAVASSEISLSNAMCVSGQTSTTEGALSQDHSREGGRCGAGHPRQGKAKTGKHMGQDGGQRTALLGEYLRWYA